MNKEIENKLAEESSAVSSLIMAAEIIKTSENLYKKIDMSGESQQLIDAVSNVIASIGVIAKNITELIITASNISDENTQNWEKKHSDSVRLNNPIAKQQDLFLAKALSKKSTDWVKEKSVSLSEGQNDLSKK
jgi:hypothetical protein